MTCQICKQRPPEISLAVYCRSCFNFWMNKLPWYLRLFMKIHVRLDRLIGRLLLSE